MLTWFIVLAVVGRTGHAKTLPQQREQTCVQATQLLIIALPLYSLWLLHLDTETLTLFEIFLAPEALLRCHEANQLSCAQL